MNRALWLCLMLAGLLALSALALVACEQPDVTQACFREQDGKNVPIRCPEPG